jgi:hypothetical protein
MSPQRVFVIGLAGFLAGAAVAAALFIPVFGGHFPATMRAIPVAHYVDPRIVRQGSPVVPADCQRLEQIYNFSAGDLGAAGFDLATSAERMTTDAVLQEVWERKSWLGKARVGLFGPGRSDFQEARIAAERIGSPSRNMSRISDILIYCGTTR